MDRAAYDQFADLEEDHFWFRGRRAIFLAILDRFLAARPPLGVLEVGCGAGGLLRRLDRFGNHPIGLELDQDLAAVCHERATSASVVVGSAYDLPFRSSSRELIALFDTLEHLEHEGPALAEVRRTLTPGGLLVVSVPAYQVLYANNDKVAHHFRRYTRRRLRRVIESSGFERRKVTYFNTLLFPAIGPAVLLGKLKERLIGVDAEHTNLSVALPSPVNRLLTAVLSSERHLLTRVSVPVGHSIVGVWARSAPTAP